MHYAAEIVKKIIAKVPIRLYSFIKKFISKVTEEAAPMNTHQSDETRVVIFATSLDKNSRSQLLARAAHS